MMLSWISDGVMVLIGQIGICEIQLKKGETFWLSAATTSLSPMEPRYPVVITDKFIYIFTGTDELGILPCSPAWLQTHSEMPGTNEQIVCDRAFRQWVQSGAPTTTERYQLMLNADLKQVVSLTD